MIIDELKTILRYLRRRYYIKFKRDYITEQLKKRKGKCGRHGCCDLTVSKKIFNKIFGENCLSKEDRTKCLIWNKLPFRCYAYPFDEKDKNHLTKDICNFYWEN